MADETDDLDILNDVGDPDNAGDQGTGDSEVVAEDNLDEDEAEVPAEEEEEAEEEAEPAEDDKSDKEGKEKKPTVIEGRPTYQELKAADPELFKKVPGLKDIFFREQKFSETFASVEEAQRAATKAENFDVIEATLVNGDPSLMLSELARNAPESLPVLVDNFLPTLQKLSKQLYIQATTPVLEDLIRLAYNDGRRSGDKNLMYAAGHLAKHVFGDARIPEPRNINTGPHPAEVQLRQERDRHFNERYNTFNTDVTEVAYTRLEKLADRGIVDPDNKLTAFSKKAIVKETLAELDRKLGEDQQLSSTLRQLWRRATVGGFTQEHKEAILNAHLSRAKQLLPGIRNRMVAEALGQKLVKGKPTNDKKRDLPAGGRGAVGGQRQASMDPKKIDWSKTSDADIISGKVTLRK